MDGPTAYWFIDLSCSSLGAIMLSYIKRNCVAIEFVIAIWLLLFSSIKQYFTTAILGHASTFRAPSHQIPTVTRSLHALCNMTSVPIHYGQIVIAVIVVCAMTNDGTKSCGKDTVLRSIMTCSFCMQLSLWFWILTTAFLNQISFDLFTQLSSEYTKFYCTTFFPLILVLK